VAEPVRDAGLSAKTPVGRYPVGRDSRQGKILGPHEIWRQTLELGVRLDHAHELIEELPLCLELRKQRLVGRMRSAAERIGQHEPREHAKGRQRGCGKYRDDDDDKTDDRPAGGHGLSFER
jgi:hypothetical protein